MDYKYIEQLMERYWECETSLEEEEILRTFFSQKDVPARLLPYKDVFTYEHDEPKSDVLGDDFDQRVLSMTGEDDEAPRARTITLTQRLMPLFRAAAVVAMILTLGNALQVPFEEQVPVATTLTDQPTTNGVSVAVSDTVTIDLANKN